MLLCGDSSKYYQNRILSARVSYMSTSQHAVTYSYTNICHSMTPSILVTVFKSVTIPSKSNNYYYLLKTHWGVLLPRTVGRHGDRRWRRTGDGKVISIFGAAHPPFMVALRSDGFGKRIFLMEDEKPIVYKQLQAERKA